MSESLLTWIVDGVAEDPISGKRYSITCSEDANTDIIAKFHAFTLLTQRYPYYELMAVKGTWNAYRVTSGYSREPLITEVK